MLPMHTLPRQQPPQPEFYAWEPTLVGQACVAYRRCLSAKHRRMLGVFTLSLFAISTLMVVLITFHVFFVAPLSIIGLSLIHI